MDALQKFAEQSFVEMGRAMSDRKHEAKVNTWRTLSQSHLPHALKYKSHIPVPDREQPDPVTNTLTMFHHECKWVSVLDFHAKVSNVLEKLLDTITSSRKARKTNVAAIKKRSKLEWARVGNQHKFERSRLELSRNL